MFSNLKRLVTSSRSFLFFSIKRNWVQRKKSSYVFHGLFKNDLFPKVSYIRCFGLFTKTKNGYGNSFYCRFSSYIFHKKSSYQKPYQMTRFQYYGRVASWVKTLQLESERSRFKPHFALSWTFYNFYLAVPQPTLGYSQSESLTYTIFIKKISTILIWSWPGALSWLNFVTRSLVTFGSKLFQYRD